MNKKIENNTIYKVQTKKGNILEVADFGMENGASVRVFAETGQKNQNWIFAQAEDGFYRILNEASGKALDVMLQGATNGSWVHQWELLDADSQLWAVEGTDTVKIRSKLSGRCIDLVGMSDAHGTQVQIWDDVNGEGQSWTLVMVDAPEAKPAKAKAVKAAPKAAPKAKAAPAKKAAAPKAAKKTTKK